MTAVRSEMAGSARYNPSRVLSNAELEAMVDTKDQWIRERTGISERRIAEPQETIAHMGTQCAQAVLDETGVDVSDVDTIILGTASPDRLLPSNACDLQACLGAKNAAAFDVSAACSGFLYAATVADSMVRAGSARHALVIGAERLSRITNYQDRATCILFGDGCGATLVRPSTNGRGILSTFMRSDGTLGDLLYRPGGGGIRPPDESMLADGSYYIAMAGREVFRYAVRAMAEACDEALRRAGLSIDDIDVMIPHQANIRIIEATAKHAGLARDRVYVNIDRYGNTSAASIPMALDECRRSGRIGEGSTVLLVAFGGGFTWASMVVRW